MAEWIRLEAAQIGYKHPLLAPLDLSVLEGQRLAVLGPNGGGKSTLLKSIAGLLPLLNGRRVLPLGVSPRLGYVPQAHRADPLYPLTAFQVALQGRFGLIGVGRFPGRKDQDIAAAKLAQVGLEKQAHTPFRALSGGQRQRVLLARALCAEPQLLLLDEFTSDMDPPATAALLAEVSRLAQAERASVMFITHEISAAATHATHVALVDARRQVFETGPASELLTSERLTNLYGQTMRVERKDGRTLVFLESQSEGAPWKTP